MRPHKILSFGIYPILNFARFFLCSWIKFKYNKKCDDEQWAWATSTTYANTSSKKDTTRFIVPHQKNLAVFIRVPQKSKNYPDRTWSCDARAREFRRWHRQKINSFKCHLSFHSNHICFNKIIFYYSSLSRSHTLFICPQSVPSSLAACFSCLPLTT